ncbi:MAG: TonB-dependent receptor, partial [Acetobacter orientalis]
MLTLVRSIVLAMLCFVSFTVLLHIEADASTYSLDQKYKTKNNQQKKTVYTEQIIVTALSRSSTLTRPAGQTTYSSDRSNFANQVGQSVADMVVTIP